MGKVVVKLTQDEAERVRDHAMGKGRDSEGDYPPLYGSPEARIDDRIRDKLDAALSDSVSEGGG